MTIIVLAAVLSLVLVLADLVILVLAAFLSLVLVLAVPALATAALALVAALLVQEGITSKDYGL